MQHSIDPKPFGAFIEYTIKPILEDSRELIELADQKGLPIRELLDKALKLYLVDKITSFVQAIVVTGMICYTIYLCLSMTS